MMKNIKTFWLIILTVISISNVNAQSTAEKIKSLEMGIQLALRDLYDNKPYLNEEYNFEKNEYGEDIKVRRFCYGFFFQNGDLMFRIAVDKQVKGLSGSDYNNFEEYELKTWIPIKYFDRIVYYDDDHFVIWTNVEASVRLHKKGQIIAATGHKIKIDDFEDSMGIEFYPNKLENVQRTVAVVNEAFKSLKQLYAN
jgi:hypothetical protein